MTQFIFRQGDEIFCESGLVKTVRLGALSRALPEGMRASYTVSYLAGGTERVCVTLQARSKFGRRYSTFRSETEAQKNVLRWAARVMRERTAEEMAVNSHNHNCDVCSCRFLSADTRNEHERLAHDYDRLSLDVQTVIGGC